MSVFKEGDLVMLKSGGSLMTVARFEEFLQPGGPVQGVVCIWEDAKGVVQNKAFVPHVLKLVELED